VIGSHLFLWLRPAVRVVSEGHDLLLVDAAGQVVHVHDPSRAAFHFTELLDGTRQAALLKNDPLFSIIMPLLIERGWLVTLRSPITILIDKFPNLTREISAFVHIYPDEADYHFELSSGKRVLIVGAGGIGTEVAFGLAAAGVGSLVVVDPDVVDATNLNRQFLYTRDDVGQQKVLVLAREINRRFCQTSIVSICENFDQRRLAKRLISSVDLIVLCGESTILQDEPELVQGRPLLLSGYRGALGTVGPLVNEKKGGACWHCIMNYNQRASMKKLEALKDNRRFSWNPSGFAINALTGAITSRICVSVLSEQSDQSNWIGQQLQIALDHLELKPTKIEPSLCSHSTNSN